MSEKATGPGGQCCAKCEYVFQVPRGGGLMCRRFPVQNSVELKMPDTSVLTKEPQMPVPVTQVGHPYTVDYEWCGEFKPAAGALQ